MHDLNDEVFPVAWDSAGRGTVFRKAAEKARLEPFELSELVACVFNDGHIYLALFTQ